VQAETILVLAEVVKNSNVVTVENCVQPKTKGTLNKIVIGKLKEGLLNRRLNKSDRVVLAAVILAGFGAAHLIDDFQFGVPDDLGLSNEIGQALAVVYFSLTSWLIVLAARQKKAGYIGNMGLGLFLIVADITKHGREGLFAGPWRTGIFSRVLAFGVIVSSLLLVVASFDAWRRSKD
jgi:hypothetical protein